MAWQTDLDSTHNPATSTVAPASWGDQVNENFRKIGGAWVAYTPAWTSSGTAPVIGNGTISGLYKSLDKLLFVRINLVAGSSTTFGTGILRYGLPASLTSKTPDQIMSAYIYDTSANTFYVCGAVASADPYVYLIANGVAGGLTGTSLITLASGDNIVISGAIEVQ